MYAGELSGTQARLSKEVNHRWKSPFTAIMIVAATLIYQGICMTVCKLIAKAATYSNDNSHLLQKFVTTLTQAQKRFIKLRNIIWLYGVELSRLALNFCKISPYYIVIKLWMIKQILTNQKNLHCKLRRCLVWLPEHAQRNAV